MYGVDDAEAAETALTVAKTEKMRADALAAVKKVEAEYDELVRGAELAIISALVPTTDASARR